MSNAVTNTSRPQSTNTTEKLDESQAPQRVDPLTGSKVTLLPGAPRQQNELMRNVTQGNKVADNFSNELKNPRTAASRSTSHSEKIAHRLLYGRWPTRGANSRDVKDVHSQPVPENETSPSPSPASATITQQASQEELLFMSCCEVQFKGKELEVAKMWATFRDPESMMSVAEYCDYARSELNLEARSNDSERNQKELYAFLETVFALSNSAFE